MNTFVLNAIGLALLFHGCSSHKSGSKAQSADAMRDDVWSDTSDFSSSEDLAQYYLLVKTSTPDAKAAADGTGIYDTLATFESSGMRAPGSFFYQEASAQRALFGKILTAIQERDDETMIELLATDSLKLLQVAHAVMHGGPGYSANFAKDISAAEPRLVMDFFDLMITKILASKRHDIDLKNAEQRAVDHALKIYHHFFEGENEIEFVTYLLEQNDSLTAVINGIDRGNIPDDTLISGRLAMIAKWQEVRAELGNGKGSTTKVKSKSGNLMATRLGNGEGWSIKFPEPNFVSPLPKTHLASQDSAMIQRRAVLQQQQQVTQTLLIIVQKHLDQRQQERKASLKKQPLRSGASIEPTNFRKEAERILAARPAEKSPIADTIRHLGTPTEAEFKASILEFRSRVASKLIAANTFPSQLSARAGAVPKLTAPENNAPASIFDNGKTVAPP